MKPTVVSADVLFEGFRGLLNWEWVAGLGASERRFDEVAIKAATSGADLVGYLNYIHPYRVQIMGHARGGLPQQRHARRLRAAYFTHRHTRATGVDFGRRPNRPRRLAVDV